VTSGDEPELLWMLAIVTALFCSVKLIRLRKARSGAIA